MIKKIRNQILQEAKLCVAIYGWNDNLFLNISNKSKFNYDEIKVLFPYGYKTILQMYLDEINNKMTANSVNLDLIRLKTHERIRELIILRLKILEKEKKLIQKTFLYLLLPHNYRLSSKNLFKVVDQIWFLSGDNSTDFNFYSKRIILGSIYTNTMIHFINNKNIEETIIILNKQLKRVSQIPKLKKRITNTVNLIPKLFRLGNFFPIFKQ